VERFSAIGWFGFVWGVGGVIAMLVWAVVRLIPRALDPIEQGMSPLETIAYVVSVLFIGYTEGYRGFQKQFSPRVVVRALHVARDPRALDLILSPLFVMGHFRATRYRLAVSWGITVGVVLLVVAVRFLDQPWRGIVDGGVVIGLSWGAISIAAFTVRALIGRPPEVASDVA
jgi:hypothetical protein